MKNIDEIFEQFNNLKHPPMNAPKDDRLSDLRQSFELDVDSIAGFFSYATKGKKSPYEEQLLTLNESLQKAQDSIKNYEPSSEEDIEYKNNVIEYLNHLMKIINGIEAYIHESNSN